LKCLAAAAAAGALAQAPVCAQTSSEVPNLETQQRTNERIRELSASARTPAHDYTIGRGDLLSVEVFDVPELTRDLRVGQTGTVGMPLIPVRLFVVGLTELQAQQKIAEVLEANGLVSHPQVMVSVKEKRSKPITIVGAVQHSMVFQADRPVTIVELLAEAGGIAPDAGDTVIITRSENPSAASIEPPEIGPEDAVPVGNPAPPETGPPAVESDRATSKVAPQGSEALLPERTPEAVPEKTRDPAPPAVAGTASKTADNQALPPPITDADTQPPPMTITVNLAELLERGNTQNNVVLQAGDVVTVPHAGIVYALGAVRRPGGFVATGDRAQLSTLKVLALAGGMTRVARKDRAVIIRKDSLGKQQEIQVDLAKIIDRKSEDVRLMPSDILYIPDNYMKAALIRTAEIAVVVATSVVIYRAGQF
jgi:polysaccharide export outer membrane protein